LGERFSQQRQLIGEGSLCVPQRQTASNPGEAMSSSPTPPFFAAVLLSGCAQIKLLDPELIRLGERLGSTSGALVETNTRAADSRLHDRIHTVGHIMLDMVLRHHELDAHTPALPKPRFAVLWEPNGADRSRWDGAELRAAIEDDVGAYRVALEYDDWAEESSSPTLSNAFEVVAEIDDEGEPMTVRIYADYGYLLFDQRMRPIGGEIDLHYVMHSAQEMDGAYLSARYEAWQGVSIFTR